MNIVELNGLFRGIISIVSFRERILQYRSPRIGELMKPFFTNSPSNAKEYADEWTHRLQFAITKLKKKRKRMHIDVSIKDNFFKINT